MSKKDSSYDKRLYEGNFMGCWTFGLSYIVAFIVSFFKSFNLDYLQTYGIVAIGFSLYEITRSHNNIGNIVDRYEQEVRDLKKDNYALKEEIYDLKRKLREYE